MVVRGLRWGVWFRSEAEVAKVSRILKSRATKIDLDDQTTSAS